MNKLGPYDLDTIVTGDARELAKAIPDESVDLIFTDPVYDQIDDYRWLAETAARVLKPDSACLVWTATPLLSTVLTMVDAFLAYAWMMHMQKHGPCYPGKPGICVISQCLWLEKGNSRTYKKVADWHSVSSGHMRGNKHTWAKPMNVIRHWINAFSLNDHIIFDPFTGGGTVPAVCQQLGRHYLAFEIDPETAELARQRVAMTQPPLFVMEPEQLELIQDEDSD